MCVWDGRGSISFRTLGFSIRFCLKYHLSLITSVTLRHLLIIVLAVPQFPYLKMEMHLLLFNKYWLGAYSIPGTVLGVRDAAINKKTEILVLKEFPFYRGKTKLTGRVIVQIKTNYAYEMPSTLPDT